MNIIQRHKSSYNEEYSRNFIDAYYRERNIRRSKGDPSAEYFTDDSLVGTLVQLIGDGILSVAGVTCIFIQHVINNKEDQEKVYAEVNEVVGKGRIPAVEDKNKMPYTSSLIWEIMRTTDFFPLFVSQQCIKETTVRGYKIPKGALTLINFNTCHNDPETYKDPKTFNPSRFMQQGKQKQEHIPITFGIGKRACIGKSYAMIQVFLFLSAIVQNFKLTATENILDDPMAIAHEKAKVCALLRN